MSINYIPMKLKKQFAHPWVTDQQRRRQRRTKQGRGSRSEGKLWRVLTLELRPKWLLLPPTSPVTSWSPLPCLQNFWAELGHLSSLPPAAPFLHWPTWRTSPLLAFHRPSLPTSGVWSRKQSQQERRFQFSLFAPIIPFGQTRQKAPQIWVLPLTPNTLTRYSGSGWKFLRAQGQCLTIFKTLLKNSPSHEGWLWIIVVFQSLYKVICKETKLFY